MFTLRCTARLAKRLAPVMAAAPPAPTARLGDWYANLVHIGRKQLVLAVSERTFLPVVLAAAPSATLVPRLRTGVDEVLRALGVAELDVQREHAAMQDFVYAKTANRQVTGVMVELARMLVAYMEVDGCSMLDLTLKVAHTPCSPLYGSTTSPDATAVALFGAPPLSKDRWKLFF